MNRPAFRIFQFGRINFFYLLFGEVKQVSTFHDSSRIELPGSSVSCYPTPIPAKKKNKQNTWPVPPFRDKS